MDKKIINDIANKLEDIKNETINEQEVPDNVRDLYYNFSDGVSGLEDLNHDNDPILKKIEQDAKKLATKLMKHLDKKYNKKWD